MPTIHLIIKGKVQGVFFRASAKEKANDLGLTGWVKNTPEGDVEIMATGEMDVLERFITWCKKGPSRAIVTEVQLQSVNEKKFERFRIER